MLDRHSAIMLTRHSVRYSNIIKDQLGIIRTYREAQGWLGLGQPSTPMSFSPTSSSAAPQSPTLSLVSPVRAVFPDRSTLPRGGARCNAIPIMYPQLKQDRSGKTTTMVTIYMLDVQTILMDLEQFSKVRDSVVCTKCCCTVQYFNVHL